MWKNQIIHFSILFVSAQIQFMIYFLIISIDSLFSFTLVLG